MISRTLFWQLFVPIASCDAAEPWQLGFQDAATPMKQGMIDSHDDIPVLLIIILLFVLWMWFGLWHFHYHRDLPIPGSALDKFFREKEAEDEKERRILRSRFYLLSITIINSILFLMCFYDIIIPGLIAFYEVIKVIPGSIAFYEEVILEFFHIKTFLHISEFAPISLYLVISLLLSLILIGVSFVFASSGSAYPDKLSAYECGFDPFDDARSRFDIRFYLVSILFIIFDLEVTFLFPWAVSLNKIGWFGFWSMMVFLWILTIGFLYEWKKGALDWE